MPTRRAIMLGTIASGIAVRTGTALSKASQPATPLNFDVPAGACDCHTHIFGEPEKFPFFAGRVYTPEMALPEEMAALHQSRGLGGHGLAMGHGGFGGHRVAINRGSIGHGRLEGRRFGRGFYAYGGNYCDPYYYPYGCYGY
jgi:hypothetical protein